MDCLWCGSNFKSVRKTTIYCCHDCRYTSMKARNNSNRGRKYIKSYVTKECKWCGIVYKTKNNLKKYCTPTCKKEFMKFNTYATRNPKIRLHIPVECPECNTMFTRASGKQVFCSPKCNRLNFINSDEYMLKNLCFNTNIDSNSVSPDLLECYRIVTNIKRSLKKEDQIEKY